MRKKFTRVMEDYHADLEKRREEVSTILAEELLTGKPPKKIYQSVADRTGISFRTVPQYMWLFYRSNGFRSRQEYMAYEIERLKMGQLIKYPMTLKDRGLIPIQKLNKDGNINGNYTAVSRSVHPVESRNMPASRVAEKNSKAP